MFSPGPYQPSYDVMLKFYGYYKQATQGKCNDPKPSFWDVVGKAKWEAWNKCGNMSERDAMTLYIEELKQVTTANSIFNFDLKFIARYIICTSLSIIIHIQINVLIGLERFKGKSKTGGNKKG